MVSWDWVDPYQVLAWLCWIWTGCIKGLNSGWAYEITHNPQPHVNPTHWPYKPKEEEEKLVHTLTILPYGSWGSGLAWRLNQTNLDPVINLFTWSELGYICDLGYKNPDLGSFRASSFLPKVSSWTPTACIMGYYVCGHVCTHEGIVLARQNWITPGTGGQRPTGWACEGYPGSYRKKKVIILSPLTLTWQGRRWSHNPPLHK